MTDVLWGRVITAEKKLHDEKQLKLIIEECAEKVVGELQKRTVTETGENQKSIVEECAAKVLRRWWVNFRRRWPPRQGRIRSSGQCMEGDN